MLHNSLVPEITVSDFEKSLHFYTEVLGFHVEYMRENEGFAFLSYEGSQLMIDQIDIGRTWKTGEMERPFGRGVNFQINVPHLKPLLDSLLKSKIQLFAGPEEKTYKTESGETKVKQFLVQDYDGYLLRFCEAVS